MKRKLLKSFQKKFCKVETIKYRIAKPGIRNDASLNGGEDDTTVQVTTNQQTFHTKPSQEPGQSQTFTCSEKPADILDLINDWVDKTALGDNVEPHYSMDEQGGGQGFVCHVEKFDTFLMKDGELVDRDFVEKAVEKALSQDVSVVEDRPNHDRYGGIW